MKPRILIYQGQPVAAPDLARRNRVPLSTLLSRIDRLGWPVERAADTPPDRRFRKGGRRKRSQPRPCPPLAEREGQAYCRWREGTRRRTRWFGRVGSDEARAGYARFAAEWAAHHGPLPARGGAISVAALAGKFRQWAAGPEGYRKNGEPTSEVYAFRSACNTLVTLYGSTPAAEFGPARLRAVRAKWLDAGLCRDTINGYVRRVIVVLAWGVARELVPAGVLAPLREVEPLTAGRTTASDPEPVTSVAPEVIEKTIPHLHADAGRRGMLERMVRLQWVSGLRPGELCAMRPEWIDRTAEPWCYDTRNANKNLHREKPRKVWFGPRAREILGPLLAEAVAGHLLWRFPALREGKRTAITRLEYARWITKACERAGIEPWTPNQLRHRRATDVHEKYEDDTAVAAALGNTPEVARQVYVDSPADRVGKRIAEETG